MSTFDQKYGFKEDEQTRAFHRSRRMFCIFDGTLHIAKPDVSYSHAAWFEKEGWINKKNDTAMNEIVRGIVDAKGDVYFYVGYDFHIDLNAEEVFFENLGDLTSKLHISPDAHIYGGMIKKEPGEIWPPEKHFGTARKYIK